MFGGLTSALSNIATVNMTMAVGESYICGSRDKFDFVGF